MNRNILRKIHGAAAATATLCIFCFWTATLFSELFLDYPAIAAVKQAILYAFWLFVPCMALTRCHRLENGR